MDNPTIRLIKKYEKEICNICQKVIDISIELGTFDFNFFRGEINEDLLNVLTFNKSTGPEDQIESLKNFYKYYEENNKELSEMEMLAISFFLKFYKVEKDNGYELLDSIISSNDTDMIKILTGKEKLSKSDFIKIKERKISLMELIKNGI